MNKCTETVLTSFTDDKQMQCKNKIEYDVCDQFASDIKCSVLNHNQA